jgi:glycosyltransferase involved in cell wall biosynthesis
VAAYALPQPRGHAIDRVAVVMPAHNEDEHLGRALLAVQRAADALFRIRPGVEVGVTVVLDSCTDGSAGIAAGYAAADRRFSAVDVRFRNAGASREAGIRAAADAVLGSVEPDPAGMDPELLRRWLERHPFEEDHPHIYGANFGVRASAYLAAGGFPKLASHEDRTLVQSLRSRAFTVMATDSMRVLTSGRTQSRAPHGFGAYLRSLGRRPAAAAAE